MDPAPYGCTVKEHQALGDPDAPFELTKRDQRRQQEAERLRDHVRRMHFHQITGGESAGCFTSHTHDDDEIGHLHPPERQYPGRDDGGFVQEVGPSVGRAGPPIPKAAAELIGRMLASKTPDDQVMRWRLRLFCGHIVERTAHISHTDISSAFHSTATCPECGLDPATIVAGKPLGAKAERVVAQQSTDERARLRDAVTKRLRRAEAEVERLRDELTTLDTNRASS